MCNKKSTISGEMTNFEEFMQQEFEILLTAKFSLTLKFEIQVMQKILNLKH